MGYLISNGTLQISGTISIAEVNALGTTPYIFTTPENFLPISFCLTAISGTTQPDFGTALLHFETISANRLIFIGNDPANINFYNIFGYPARPIPNPTHVACLNIELISNNFRLTPSNFLDPIAGDYVYKYNLIGTILQ
jgi:hypothetical protein